MIGRIGSVGRLGLGGGRRLLYPRHVQEFLDRRTAADVTAGFTTGLERGVTDAFSTCIEALVAAGYLGISGGILAQAASVIKAGVPMLGAGTLPGALIPWAGDTPTPTNFNFVPGDYNRKTGLGDPANTNKYLATGRLNNADPQNDNHNAVYATEVAAANGGFIGGIGLATSGSNVIIGGTTAQLFTRNRSTQGTTDTRFPAAGLISMSRSTSASYLVRCNQVNATVNVASNGTESSQILVFRRGDTASPIYAQHRLCAYSVGLSLDQAIYESILATLAASITAAIP